jgi:histidyl-tRNA synthetase
LPEKHEWRSPRGTHDILPEHEAVWRHVRNAIERRASDFGYGRIETPIFEERDVFIRAIGEATDIIQKEMFEVRRATATNNEEQDTFILRPEGTAAVIRAYFEHGLQTWPQPVKLWYFGPMFRAERPQRGRYRQFWQGGLEILGDNDPTTDALLIYLFWQILGDLHIRDGLIVDINSMGCSACRPKYRKALTAYYQPATKKLCPTCQNRLAQNPLRLLDCKEDECQDLKKDAPQLVESLCTACREHFRIVLESLDELGVVYNLKSTLVRGFDYYTRTTFEIRAIDDDRSQNALGGGGRYDNLIEQFGGKATAAIGLAIGIERLLLRLENLGVSVPALPAGDVFVIQLGERAKKACFNLVARLGDEGLSALCQPTKDSLKTQLRLADKAGVRFALIIGQREALDETAILRNMVEATQETILQSEIVDVLKSRLRSDPTAT